MTIRNLKTSWLESGQLRPAPERVFFLIHGFPDDAEIWGKQIPALSQWGLVIAPDLRGVGESEVTDESRYSCESTILDFMEILRQYDFLKHAKIHVIGHDIGAPIAWEFARLLGDRLGSLVIFNGPSLEQLKYRLKSPIQWLKTSYIELFQLPTLPEALVKTKWIQGLFKKSKMGEEPANGYENLIPHYRALYREAWKKIFHAPKVIHAPVLVIWGKDDPVLKVPQASEYESSASHVEIRVLDAGHWVQNQKAKQVNGLLMDFYQR